MTTKRLQRRAMDAQRLQLSGMTMREIARELGVSPRTVARDLTLDTETEGAPVELALLDASLRDSYLERATPLLLKTLDDIERRRLEGKLSNRDLIITSSTLFQNIARLSPPAQGPEEEKSHVTFVLSPVIAEPREEEDAGDGEIIEE